MPAEAEGLEEHRAGAAGKDGGAGKTGTRGRGRHRFQKAVAHDQGHGESAVEAPEGRGGRAPTRQAAEGAGGGGQSAVRALPRERQGEWGEAAARKGGAL